MKIDAKSMHYKKLNEKIRELIGTEVNAIELENVNGQRYIGAGIGKDIKIAINGVPGNALGIFMDGPTITVNANAQDGVGNTMNSGKIVVHGFSGDIVGYSMRGGKIFVRNNVGYRVGIHMKEYKEQKPVIIIGGVAMDYLGEYMAGGVLIVLGLGKEKNQPIAGNYIGTGMHSGVMYIRGKIENHQVGKGVGIIEPNGDDKKQLRKYLEEYCKDFGLDLEEILMGNFIKLAPLTHRPYGNLYSH